jgi:hypothetical protein
MQLHAGCAHLLAMGGILPLDRGHMGCLPSFGVLQRPKEGNQDDLGHVPSSIYSARA